MDISNVHYRTNPRLKVNFFSWLFVCWIFPFLSYGNRHQLNTKDVFQLAPENRSEYLGNKLERYWKAEVKNAQRSKRKPRLWRVIIKIFGYKYLKYAILAFVATLAPMLLPAALKLLIYHFEENSTSTMLEACSYALLIMLIMTGQVLLFNHSYSLIRYIGGQMMAACSSLIYKKILRLPINSPDRSDGGRIITLLSNDISRFEEAFVLLHTILVVPVTFIINGFLMWRMLGVAALFPVLFVILQSIPVQVFSVSFMIKLREKAAQKTDDRLLLIDEIINGIRVIKMYTWEKPFEQFILLARRKELDLIIKKLFFHTVSRECLSMGMFITVYATIGTLIACNNKVTSLIVFPLIQYIYHLNLQSGNRLSRCLIALTDVTATVNRIEDFMLLEEITFMSKLPITSDPKDWNSEIVVNVKNVTASWPGSEKYEILQNVNVSIARKKLYAVVGEIGSGKSSLLKVILGELKLKSGQVLNYGDISFANQEPWLFNGSIRSNILLGEPYNEEKYNQVISSCALLKDFDQLPYGDKTIVGERGASLSGGQSARINLARAVYRNVDVYLLDDPLASIDFCVGKCLFEKCINGLLKDKTRVLVTQKLEYIKNVDEVILINNGQIEYQGDYENFRKTNFYQHLSKNRKLGTTLTNNIIRKLQASSSSYAYVDAEENKTPEFDDTTELLSEYKNGVQLKAYKDPQENVEPIKHGKIPFGILKEFYNNKGLIIFITIFLITSRMCIGSFNYLVSVWSENQDKHLAVTNATVLDDFNRKSNFTDSQIRLFYIIGSAVLGTIIAYLIALILFYRLHRESCERLHSNMICSLLNATVQFFDINDSGRILNRFSQDLGTVDEQVPIIVMEVFKLSIEIIIAILQIIIASPFMCIPFTISVFLVWRTTIFFSKSIRSTKRLEARAKALVLSHANATFNGLITIRSSGAEATVQRHFNTQLDNYMATCFTNIDVFLSYYLWIEFLLYNFNILVAFCLIFFKSTGITGATAGFIMSQTLFISKFMFVTAEFVTTFDSLMISTERTVEYTKLEQEKLKDKKCQKERYRNLTSTLSNNGEIKFDHLYVKYSNSTESVLRNINFVVEPGMKIGIIGRTGAGKSTLVAAIFHLVKIEGSLIVDGSDTKTMPLKDLRRKISIIPQKSILFSTSLRNNLDPLKMFDDATIWSALKCAQLNNIFNSLDQELDQRSLSSGQRQLLCLARAILKKNKILILDEATANMDALTDDLINKIIRDNFKDCTVLTIAHKLNSVVDCDKILVIDEGRVIEYDEPRALLQKKNSYFYKMCQAV